MVYRSQVSPSLRVTHNRKEQETFTEKPGATNSILFCSQPRRITTMSNQTPTYT